MEQVLTVCIILALLLYLNGFFLTRRELGIRASNRDLHVSFGTTIVQHNNILSLLVPFYLKSFFGRLLSGKDSKVLLSIEANQAMLAISNNAELIHFSAL